MCRGRRRMGPAANAPIQSADTVRPPAQRRSAATFSAMTTASGRVASISCAIMAAVTGCPAACAL